MANIHLIIGSTGAGKSTYSRLIAERHAGVRFAIDEWMLELFGPDRPDDAGYDFYAPRIERSTRMIWSLVLALAEARVPSVLEIGLTTRAAREAFYRQVKAAGLPLAALPGGTSRAALAAGRGAQPGAWPDLCHGRDPRHVRLRRRDVGAARRGGVARPRRRTGRRFAPVRARHTRRSR